MKPIKVAFYGSVAEPTGMGTAAKAHIHALHAANIDLSVINLAFSQESDDPLIASLLDKRVNPDFHLVDYMPIAAVPLTLYFDRLILASVWETESLPRPWLSIMRNVCDLWVPCEHNVSVFQEQVGRTVFKLPHALAAKVYEPVQPDFSKLPLIGDSEFVFYSIFVWQPRKYPEGLIEAYFRAFPNGGNVVLILKLTDFGGGVIRVPDEESPHNVLCEIRRRVKSSARVEIVNDVWSEQQMEALEQRGNCYVSLHRGEGWGYPIFDAACRGTPVIATGYSGPLEYLDSAHHSLVKFKLVSVAQADPMNSYSAEMKWAEPNLEHAAALMEHVFDHHGDAVGRARSASLSLRKRFAPDTVGMLARERLESLLSDSGRLS
jgi:glycosyltransferase involved in cell wall biosynthesis